MSLEAALAAHQKALEANTAAILSSLGKTFAPSDPARPAQTSEVKPAPQPKAEEKPAAPAAPAPATTEIAYDRDIKPIALALAKKDRNKLLAIYKELGVNVGTEIKPEQFAKAKQMIEEASK